MILLIDNYDSFTHNLVHLVGAGGEEVVVRRNDVLSAEEAVGSDARAIVISPGPRTPNEAGICLDLIGAAAAARKPVFGVCLGMQAIVQHFGGRIVRAEHLMHGKTCNILHDGDDVFDGLPSPFTATRYHSLVAERASLPPDLIAAASAEDDNELMAVVHKDLPIVGVQFHPESIASDYGAEIIANFLKLALR